MKTAVKTVKDALRQAMKEHVEKDNGLIAGTDRLLERQIHALRLWLKAEQSAYSEHQMHDELATINDLISQLE